MRGFRDSDDGCTVVTEEISQKYNFFGNLTKYNILRKRTKCIIRLCGCAIFIKTKNIDVGENYRVLRPRNHVYF